MTDRSTNPTIVESSDTSTGRQYANDQLNSEEFDFWVYDQITEAASMPPDQVVPVRTLDDAREIARRMLQQFEWDARRQSRNDVGPDVDPDKFFNGVRSAVENPMRVERLARRIMEIRREIGADLQEVPRTMSRMMRAARGPTVTRLAGTCPVCQGVFKVRNQLMVHHGFTRPGDGYIHGDCFGVDSLAYEVSADGCEKFKAFLLRRIDQTEERIGELMRSEPAELTEYVSDFKTGFRGTIERAIKHPRGTDGYNRVRDRYIRKEGAMVTVMQSDVKRMDALIRDWTLRPLLEIDEEGLTPEMRRQKNTQRDERASQKAQREAERAARQEKAERREAEKEEEKREFLRLLQILASWPPSDNRRLQAYRLNAQMLRKYTYGLPSQFIDQNEVDEAQRLSIALGIGEFIGNQYGGYFAPFRSAIARGKPIIS